MKSKVYKNKTFAFLAVLMFIGTGTYNAVVINSESHLAATNVRFVKRLDEIYGVTVAGREVAASMNWQKLTPQQVAQHKAQVVPQVVQSVSTVDSAPVANDTVIPAAAVQEELSLNLVEEINPKKWQQGLNNTQFNGSLATNNGVIETLNVSLPNGEGVSVSFSEMVGNVFEYDLDGELYSGMMYQVDQTAYMVTLTNGPLEGTRMRFAVDTPAVEQQPVQETLAENNGVEVGNFGQEAEAAQPEQVAYAQDQVAQETLLADHQTQLQEQEALNYDQQMQMQSAQSSPQIEQQQQF